MVACFSVLRLLPIPVLIAGCAVTPEPLDSRQNGLRASAALEQAIESQEKLSGPVSLYEAMARALKYNLDHKIEMMEEALRIAQVDMRHYDMLPAVMANSGYAR